MTNYRKSRSIEPFFRDVLEFDAILFCVVELYPRTYDMSKTSCVYINAKRCVQQALSLNELKCKILQYKNIEKHDEKKKPKNCKNINGFIVERQLCHHISRNVFDKVCMN